MPRTGKNKFAIVQSEDEISAIGTVIGAGWNGARAFTATSGPGISLMQEFLGLAYFAEIPAVIIDVQRGGPSTGMPTRTQQSDLLICAYASHGDTKHVLLLPEDPRELFEFCALSFDLAERLQTPVFVLEDLDIGMNEWLCEPFTWDDTRLYDRGKVMTAGELEAGKTFGRYLDVDGDAIPYRTLPGTHPAKGAFFTRGTSRDRFAKYSEEGAVYQDNMQRLLRKFKTAKSLVPAPVIRAAREKTRCGAIYFGSTSPAMKEALAALEADNIHLDTLRLRAFPFSDAVLNFINSHDQIFLVEQNRDAQMRSLLVNECGIDPARFISILHYDGTPTAVSQKIKLLERRCGKMRCCFSRTTQAGRAHTSRARASFQRLRPAIADVEDALAALGDYRGRPSGNLRITAPRASGAWLVAPLVARMRERTRSSRSRYRSTTSAVDPWPPASTRASGSVTRWRRTCCGF